MSVDNSLITAFYPYTLPAKRLLLTAISLVDPRKHKATDVVVVPVELVSTIYTLDTHKGLIFDLQKAVKDLLETPLIIRDAGKTIETPWLSSATYDKTKRSFNLIFSKAVSSRITHLTANYTRIRLMVLASLRRRYSISLFELLMQRRDLGTYEIGVDDFRFAMGTTKHSDYRVLRRELIAPAIADINTYTPYFVSMTPVKVRKRVTRLRFDFWLKPGQVEPLNLQPSDIAEAYFNDSISS